MADEIARYYDASKNPGTPSRPAALPGVPLRDLTKDEFDRMPAHVQASIDASPFYRKSKPKSSKSDE